VKKLYNFNQWCRVNEDVEQGGVPCSLDENDQVEKTLASIKVAVSKAISFWKEWIGDPITREKFKKSYKYDDAKVEEIFKKYISTMDIIEIKPYGRCSDGNPQGFNYSEFLGKTQLPKSAYACVVNGIGKPYLFCNMKILKSISELEIENVMVHEVQHILHNLVHPLNPETKLDNCFGVGNDVSNIKNTLLKSKPKPFDILPKILVKTITPGLIDGGVKPLMGTFNLTEVQAKRAMTSLVEILSGSEEYAAEYDEIMSRVMSIRHANGLKPGQDITIEHLKPAVLKLVNRQNPNSVEGDINLILGYWAMTGYNNLNFLLRSMNALALQQSSSNIKTS
jgi:hypothetical protein